MTPAAPNNVLQPGHTHPQPLGVPGDSERVQAERVEPGACAEGVLIATVRRPRIIRSSAMLSHNLDAGKPLWGFPSFISISIHRPLDCADRQDGAGSGRSHTEHYTLLLRQHVSVLNPAQPTLASALRHRYWKESEGALRDAAALDRVLNGGEFFKWAVVRHPWQRQVHPPPSPWAALLLILAALPAKFGVPLLARG